MNAYYNEFDPKAAAWLRALIAERLIPDGFVDERDIRDISPVELAGFVPASSPLEKNQERRVMRLRGYGNAIVPQVAAEFVMAWMDVR